MAASAVDLTLNPDRDSRSGANAYSLYSHTPKAPLRNYLKTRSCPSDRAQRVEESRPQGLARPFRRDPSAPLGMTILF